MTGPASRTSGPAVRSTRAATLPELLVCLAILAILAGCVAGYMHRLGRSLARGEEDLTGGREVNHLLKWLTLRLGSLNPPLVLDPADHLWQLGEERGCRPLHRIWVLDTDGKADNGGEALEYLVASAEPVPRQVAARLAIRNGRLSELRGEKEEVVSRRVSQIHFRSRASDPRLLLVDLTIEIPPTSTTPRGRTVDTRVAVRPDADRVVFRSRRGDF